MKHSLFCVMFVVTIPDYS